jgi:hypothetical protein
MKLNRFASAMVLASMCVSGVALAQSSNAPTTPSTTPTDSTATPPNNPKVPPGAEAPAPMSGAPTPTAPVTRDMRSDRPGTGDRAREPSDPGNTNVTPTMGGKAPYTNDRSPGQTQ